MKSLLIPFSSLSQYAHSVDALSLEENERTQIDAQIDQIYDEIEKGLAM